MPQGLQCWDANGNLLLDVTDRLTRVLGELDTGTSNGSRTDANLSTGTPWYIVTDNGAYGGVGDISCDITINGNTLSWSFSGSVAVDKHIVYGVY